MDLFLLFGGLVALMFLGIPITFAMGRSFVPETGRLVGR